jgi:selenoprotein W-related protein
MAEDLLNEFPSRISSLKLIPSDGGRFEVAVDDQLIFSKRLAGRHAEYGEIAAAIRQQR